MYVDQNSRPGVDFFWGTHCAGPLFFIEKCSENGIMFLDSFLVGKNEYENLSIFVVGFQ